MTEKENKDEPRKQPSEDYYSGYYWGNEPCDSSHAIDARKTSSDEIITTNIAVVYLLNIGRYLSRS